MKVAVIPARGGSQRIPRKNIRPFAGKPIIAYSIRAALDARLFDRVLVSTDDEEVAAVAREHGAEVPFTRPAYLADEYTGTNSVVKHALQWLREQGTPAARACCIYATAPFVTPRDLALAHELLIKSGKDFVFSVTTFPFPIQRAIRLKPDGSVEPIFPEHIQSRSQDFEHAYHDAGQFYWGTEEAFCRSAFVFSHTSLGYILPRHQVQDIDTEEDWVRAEHMFVACRILSRQTG